MTVLVTGGAGFIGSNFLFYYIEKHPDRRVVCLDKLTYCGNIATLEPLRSRENFRFVQADICDRDAVFRIFEEEKPDAAINFAAESHVDRSIEDPGVFLRTNVLGTQVMMDACRAFGNVRFHHISTDEVYGDLPLDRPELTFSENSQIRASSPYSASKAGADLLVSAYFRTYGLPATVSRCSNNYGRFQFPEKLIPLMTINAMNDRPLPVYGTGLNVRDWIHVEDHCAAIDLILEKSAPGEVYNVGGNSEVRNIDVVKTICAVLGKPESLIAHVSDRKGHDLRYAVNAEKLQRELGWQPRHDFMSGLVQTVNWYKNNPQWWRPLMKGTGK